MALARNLQGNEKGKKNMESSFWQGGRKKKKTTPQNPLKNLPDNRVCTFKVS